MAETIEAIATQQQIDIPRRDDTFLVARNQMELQACQARLVSWFSAEVQKLEADATELNEAIEIAIKNRWRRGTMQKHLKYTLDKILFFEKCKSAAAEGYAIIPDLPCDVFAIRVDPDVAVPYDKQSQHYGVPSMREMPPHLLPEGEGEYKSEVPFTGSSFHEIRTGSDQKPYQVTCRVARDWQGVQFPVIAAKTRLMDATQEAMAKRIFDQVAIVPKSAHRKRDPMIVGRILGPTKGSNQATLTFVIAWFLDLETLR